MKTNLKHKRRMAASPLSASGLDGVARLRDISRQSSRPIRMPAAGQELAFFQDCQDLLRARMDGPLLELIPKLTGLHLQALWHHPTLGLTPDRLTRLCPQARQRMAAQGKHSERCEFCEQRNWISGSPETTMGRQFTGPCGVTSFFAHLRVDSFCPLTLVLQARVMAPDLPGMEDPDHPLVTPDTFQHAVSLTRLVIRDLEAAVQARVAGRQLRFAAQKLITIPLAVVSTPAAPVTGAARMDCGPE